MSLFVRMILLLLFSFTVQTAITQVKSKEFLQREMDKLKPIFVTIR